MMHSYGENAIKELGKQTENLFERWSFQNFSIQKFGELMDESKLQEFNAEVTMN